MHHDARSVTPSPGTVRSGFAAHRAARGAYGMRASPSGHRAARALAIVATRVRSSVGVAPNHATANRRAGQKQRAPPPRGESSTRPWLAAPVANRMGGGYAAYMGPERPADRPPLDDGTERADRVNAMLTRWRAEAVGDEPEWGVADITPLQLEHLAGTATG